MKLALILEGPGDLEAFPCLVGRVAAYLGEHIIAPNPIRTGGYHNLKRPGELERFVQMAASRADINAIIVAVDLDDDCAAKCKADFEERCAAIQDRIGVPVHMAFCVREYECWFLEDIDSLRRYAPEYDWDADFSCDDPSAKRDAKSLINAAMAKHYKPMIDQAKLTRKIDIRSLYAVSRSFRRFVKAITGCDYDVLSAAFTA